MIRHVKASSVSPNSGLYGSFGFSRAKLLVLACLALALLGALGASSASATQTHTFTGTSFGPDGTAGTSFSTIASVAVDPANGNLYVYDYGAAKIYKFDAAGNPVNFSGLGKNVIEGVPGGPFAINENQLAVAPPGSPGETAGDIYFINGSSLSIYGAAGAKLSAFSPGPEPCGVATDPAGHVFIGLFSEGAPEPLKEFVPAANPLKASDEKAVSNTGLVAVCNVGADGLGDIYAANYYGEGISKLEGMGDASAAKLDPTATSLAVDPASNDVYADRESAIVQYDSAGNQVSLFGAGQIAGSFGIAVNGTSGKVYAGNGGSQHIDVFGPQVTVATVKAEAASNIGPHKVTLNARVNPEGIAVTNCKFEYGATTAYGETAPCEGAIPTDEEDHPVTATIGGLELETSYHFRVVATNANGPSPSEDQTFATASAAFTQAAAPVGGVKATLNGIVFPEGEAVSECKFEYGATTAYGKTAPCEGAIPTDEGEHPVSAPITHLVPNGTEYHFRLVIKRGGLIEGADRSFKTAETVKTGAPSAIAPPTTTVEGQVNPEGIALTECSFDYGPTPAFGSSVPCTESPATIGEGSSPVAVHANLGGLAFETTYFYRLVASTADGTAKGKEAKFNTPGVPLIKAEQTSAVTDTEAQLIALINPKGLPTTYHLQYGLTAHYGQSTEEFEVGADETVHSLTTVLEGLTPDTTYHWRAVAVNSHGAAAGPDRAFTTFPTFSPDTGCPNQEFRSGASANLPDCRAYELVSPAQKAGEVFPPEPGGVVGVSCNECLPGISSSRIPMQSRPDGEAILYEGNPFGEGLSAKPNEYLAHRSASGWGTQSLSPGIVSGLYETFSTDLTRGLLSQAAPAPSAEAPVNGEGEPYANLYLRGEDGTLQPLIVAAPPQREPSGMGNSFNVAPMGANAGTEAAAPFSHVIFRANDALTGATPFAPAAPAIPSGQTFCNVESNCNLYEWTGGQLRLVNVLPGNATALPSAVFGAGFLLTSNAIHASPTVDHAISDDGSRIFWSNGTSGQLYVRIDGEETQKIEDPGKFLTAAADGSKVLLSDGCLYSLEEAECEEDLTDGQGGFEGILGAGEDLLHVYFIDTKVLTGAEENANGEHAAAGKFNLYAWHGGATVFIGALREEDNGFSSVADVGTWKASIPDRLAQASPDGRYLAFMSTASLTGYDNEPKDGGCGGFEFSGKPYPCFEVFEYDAQAGELTCASCNPSGEQPLGESNLTLLRSQGRTFPKPGNLTADGQGRLFFESQDTLTPRDQNGHIQDVYEWEPSGLGSCKRAAGCVSLISSGHSANDSMFVDSSANGGDAFFITREQLLLQDKNEQLDLYDARVGGGISENAPPPCLGEACRGSGTAAPEAQSPGSSSFTGPGNEKPKKHKHKKKHRKHKSHKRAAKHNRGGQK